MCAAVDDERGEGIECDDAGAAPGDGASVDVGQRVHASEEEEDVRERIGGERERRWIVLGEKTGAGTMMEMRRHHHVSPPSPSRHSARAVADATAAANGKGPQCQMKAGKKRRCVHGDHCGAAPCDDDDCSCNLRN